MYGIIYKTTNILNDKIYIGQTTRLDDQNYIGSGLLIKKAIKKYGKNSFLREVLDACENQENLDNKEQFWIKKLQPDYNISLGGYGIGKMADETKEKLRQLNLGKIGYWKDKKRPDIALRMSGNNSPTKCSEVRKKMSNAAKHRLNQPFYGKTHSEETKLKISKSHIGKIVSDETKKKISDATKGKNNAMYNRSVYSIWLERYGTEEADKRQIEVNNKKSDTNSGKNNPMYGKPHSEETRKIQSEKRKLYWKNKKRM